MYMVQFFFYCILHSSNPGCKPDSRTDKPLSIGNLWPTDLQTLIMCHQTEIKFKYCLFFLEIGLLNVNMTYNIWKLMLTFLHICRLGSLLPPTSPYTRDFSSFTYKGIPKGSFEITTIYGSKKESRSARKYSNTAMKKVLQSCVIFALYSLPFSSWSLF